MTLPAISNGNPTIASQIPSEVVAWPIETSWPLASSTSAPGFHPGLTAGVGVGSGRGGRPNVTVKLPYDARSSRSVFDATRRSISPRVAVSCSWTSRTSLIAVARDMIAWSAASVVRRLAIRAPRSTTWPETSSVLISSARIVVATRRISARVVFQAGLGIR